MAHYNPSQKNPPWVRNNVQQQPMLAQQMTVQSVALSQPALTTTHLAAQNQIGQVQLTPAIQSHQVQIPLNQAHLLLNQQLTPASCTFGQVQINQAQLANIATSQHQATTHQTYFTPSISLQQNVGIPQGTIQIQPSSLVIPTSISTSIAPPGLAMPTTLSSVQNYTTTYAVNRSCVSQQQQTTVKQRVFSGLVTKLHENFGFIDEDVIFQASVVKGTAPQVGDRVLVEASYNGSMPFKWNATRVQVIAPPVVPQQQQQPPPQKLLAPTTFGQNDVSKQMNRDWSNRGRPATNDYRESDRATPKSRDSRTRERRSRSNSRSPGRKRSRSPQNSPPPRRRVRTTPRYSVQIPKVSLDCREANLLELRRRYSHMYVPSDFLSSTYWWVDSFPIHRPLQLDNPVSFHIFDKDVEPPTENTAVYEPSDADYAFSAKVMLISLLPMNEFLRKCCPEDDKEDFVHPARLIRFLVGHRGKNETMAIGGPWSPSLDGADPKTDPQVLIRTAIRTCKALTGIDLSACTQWYRVAEIRYHRVSSMKSRIESVLLFVPDVWSCVPTASQWETIVHSYMQPSNEPVEADPEAKMEEEAKDEAVDPLKEASHYSKLEPKNLKFSELKTELEARNLSSKGMRTQLVPRLTIALKCEAEEEKRKREDAQLAEEEQLESGSMESSLPADETDSSRRLDFVASPQILVHPSATAKGGKFSCSLVSLSVLLDYRLEDTKEHTFEVSLFSELINEMLMRDFGALVYRSVVNEYLRKEKRDKKEDEETEKKKKKEMKIGRIMNNAPLLLAYCYFDLSHANYIASKDLEDLFLTLGLQLSRAQVRKLIQKVVTDDCLRYKKLIEKSVLMSKEEEDQANDVPLDNPTCEVTNGKEMAASEPVGLILLNGVYVNVEQLLVRLEQSEESRRETELKFKLAQNQLAICRVDLTKSTETNSSLCRQLETEKLRADSTTEELTRLQECVNQYVQGISKIQAISNNLLASKGEVIKEEQMPLDSQILQSVFLDKAEQ
ncbi:hypothetical protein GHT06_021217 [Daphnia sinensis]|uniref:SAP domain-containing protein n=1 Tax=Daphnia sinensis TaxID=1820382 RepID=A0AAD5PQM7_9CRUS|nr:hypothetical protein GHT06_021217 [Daphnia sinensis]